jgi:hypothetical protein
MRTLLRVVISRRAYAIRDIRQHVAVTRQGRAPAPQDLATQFAPHSLDQRRLCEEPGPVLPKHRPTVAVAADDERIPSCSRGRRGPLSLSQAAVETTHAREQKHRPPNSIIAAPNSARLSALIPTSIPRRTG